MTQTRWKESFEVVGLIAIVASLIFVGFQLRQDRVIARSELGAGTAEAVLSIQEVMADPEQARVYAKMLDHPEDLSVEEMLQINRTLQMVSTLFFRECYLTDRGVFVECEELIRSHMPLYFGNKYAQAWWKESHIKPRLPNWVSEEIAGLDPGTELQRLEKIKEGL
jgi:hypothetical protein